MNTIFCVRPRGLNIGNDPIFLGVRDCCIAPSTVGSTSSDSGAVRPTTTGLRRLTARP